MSLVKSKRVSGVRSCLLPFIFDLPAGQIVQLDKNLAREGGLGVRS